MEVPRIFSLDEANGLIAELSTEFDRLARLRRGISTHLQELSLAGVHLDLAQPLGDQTLPPEHLPTLMRLTRMIREVGRIVGRVHELGCVVKDLDQGLVDFYSVLDGEPVWLCWRYGEQRVTHFHPLDTGFARRQTLTGQRRPGIVYN